MGFSRNRSRTEVVDFAEPVLLRAARSQPEQSEGLEDLQRLSECKFSDMYVDVPSSDVAMIRGLRSAARPFSKVTPGLTLLPPNLINDAMALCVEIEAAFAKSPHIKSFKHIYDDKIYRCSLIATPGAVDLSSSRTWCVRQANDSAPSFADLNLPDWLVRDFDMLTGMRGLVIICGGYGAGKSTLANSAFDAWVRASNDLGVTIEDPVETFLERKCPRTGMIRQVDISAYKKCSIQGSETTPIAQAIMDSRRWAPRYLFLGEIRAPEEAAELLRVAGSGPLVITTLHGTDCVTALQSLDSFASTILGPTVTRKMMAATLHQIVHQDLSGVKPVQKSGRFYGEGGEFLRGKVDAGRFETLADDFDRQNFHNNATLKSQGLSG